ncbi:unnamed protein product [Larinioides sclopetarius]|uniref:CCHC-type domain-containing protein n=1 Tax=Larinioides sclopetarius TaxID=280406 RepID=A0AAV1ZAD6_9ARAC
MEKFSFKVPPKSVRIAYINCPVRPYIPNPLRCFKCQKFGHSIGTCRGKETCGRCSEIGHNSKTCTSTPKCSNCKEDHPSYSRKCPLWVQEKEIQAIKVSQNISFAEARKIVKSRTPTVGISYSSMVGSCPHCHKPSTNQQTAPPTNVSPIELPKKSPVKQDNRVNAKTTPDRSSLPSTSRVNNQKVNQTSENKALQTQALSQSNSTKTTDNINHNILSRIPQTNKSKISKKIATPFKETKAMRKTRIQTTKKNLDVKIKDSIKQRTLTKQDFLKESGMSESDDDVSDFKFHPSSDDDVMCKFYEHRHYFSDYEPVFTDGSKSEDHVGTAVVMGSTIISEKMHKFCSVFTSEVYDTPMMSSVKLLFS